MNTKQLPSAAPVVWPEPFAIHQRPWRFDYRPEDVMLPPIKMYSEDQVRAMLAAQWVHCG